MTESTPSTPTKGAMSAPPVEEEPPSPASSIVSNETDAGSTKGSVTKGRPRSRGRRGRPARVSGRVTRGRIPVRTDKADVASFYSVNLTKNMEDKVLVPYRFI